MSGQIVDASLVAAPRQRKTNAEKTDIKAGRIPERWKDKPAKLSHKDRDARWTLKFTKAKPRDDGTVPAMDLAIPAYGYKNHISIDRRYRLGFGRMPRILRRLRIRRWKTTDASAHDGARLREGLLDRSNTGWAVWAATAYRSAANEQYMESNGFTSKVHHKKPPHRDMPVQTRRSNAGKSVIRSRVEHVFADQKSRMGGAAEGSGDAQHRWKGCGGLFVRTVGIKRAEMKIGLANLVYNVRRFLYLKRVNAT